MKLTFEHLKTFLAILVIPLLVWGVKLEVTHATMGEKIDRVELDIKKADETRAIVQQNRITLALLKERIDNANETLRDIKDILRRNAGDHD
tara:strand:- start:443 stop:715 length:273 start_codon:yes stop_codon:yes gene_type:complete